PGPLGRGGFLVGRGNLRRRRDGRREGFDGGVGGFGDRCGGQGLRGGGRCRCLLSPERDGVPAGLVPPCVPLGGRVPVRRVPVCRLDCGRLARFVGQRQGPARAPQAH